MQDTLSSIEVETIIAQAHQAAAIPMPGNNHAERLWPMILEVCYYGGRRIGEVLALRAKDVLADEGAVIFVPLKREDRPVLRMALPPAVISSLHHRIVFDELRPDDRLFPVTTQAANLAIKRFAQAAGIQRRVHTHMLRAASAQTMLAYMGRQQMPVDQKRAMLKEHLAHRGWGSLERYMVPSRAELETIQRQLFRDAPKTRGAAALAEALENLNLGKKQTHS